MRPLVKAGLVGIGIVVLAFVALSGTSAYFVLRHLNIGTATEEAATKDFEAIRSRFGARPHLIEVVDAGSGNFKINRPAQADGRPVTTLHIFTWKQEDTQVFRTEVPIWLMRFSTVNVLSRLGVAPERFRLTVQDIQDFGPGIIIDYRRPARDRVLIWTE